MEMGEPLRQQADSVTPPNRRGFGSDRGIRGWKKGPEPEVRGLVGAMREAEPHERSKVMPFVVKTCFQAVSLSVETYACQIRDVKIAVVVMSSLVSSLQMVLADGLGNDVAGAAGLRTLFYGEGDHAEFL